MTKSIYFFPSYKTKDYLCYRI